MQSSGKHLSTMILRRKANSNWNLEIQKWGKPEYPEKNPPNKVRTNNKLTYGTLVRGGPSAYYAISANRNITYTLNIYNLSNESVLDLQSSVLSLLLAPLSGSSVLGPLF